MCVYVQSEERFDDIINLTEVCANSSFGLNQFTLVIFNISITDIFKYVHCVFFFIHFVDIIGQLTTVNTVI